MRGFDWIVTINLVTCERWNLKGKERGGEKRCNSGSDLEIWQRKVDFELCKNENKRERANFKMWWEGLFIREIRYCHLKARGMKRPALGEKDRDRMIYSVWLDHEPESHPLKYHTAQRYPFKNLRRSASLILVASLPKLRHFHKSQTCANFGNKQ